ncbi:MAG: hypothetical protein Ct9H90mP13_00800 [Pseudomonadota bacterium]|nr:MAG: hypothetical protein Ct9H90mP13_00800 [Pseudomonadota bacterium]
MDSGFKNIYIKTFTDNAAHFESIGLAFSQDSQNLEKAKFKGNKYQNEFIELYDQELYSKA